ncbi:protein O-mannosyl-transferase Tmtc2 [Periplaneta americana]|uniref:protein O-mannosyl-transferase Tmtc2 n=1 Tax=Periplaneta americana TaxID=6978 RepID=UPI0037E71AF5
MLNANLAVSRAILSNQDVLPSTPVTRLLVDDFWGTPLSHSGSHGSYRPLCVLTFRLNYMLGGFRAWGYHLVNVLLHCLATSLVVRLARLLFPSSVPVAVTGLLFAAHPIHTEAVAGVVGRADVAACIFYLLSFQCYVAHVRHRDKLRRSSCAQTCTRCRYPRAHAHCCEHGVLDASRGRQWLCMCGCVLFASCAILSKETGVTVLMLCAGYDVLTHLGRRSNSLVDIFTKKRLRGVLVSVGCLAGTLCALLQLRLYLMGTRTPVFATADNPTARCPSAYTRFLTFAYLPVFNFGLLLWPRWLSFDWSMDAIPRITSLFDPRSTVTLLFYYLLYRITRRAFRKLTFSQNHLQQQQQKPQLYHRPRRHSHRRTAHVSAANIASKPHVSPAPLVHTGDITKATSSSPCPVCRHSLLDHHSALCRNNNNNNTIPMLGTSSAPCCCSNAVAKFSHQAAVVDGDAKKNVQPPRLRFTGKVYLSNSEVLLLSLAFIAVPFLPATNVFFYVGFVVAERVLYIPSIGYCLLIGLGCHVIHSRTNKSLVLVCVALLLAAFSVRTVQRNRDWMDEESLYRSGIPINPPKSYGNLGSVLSSQGRVEEAEWAYRMALKYRSNMADVHYNLGILLQGREQYEEAIQSYQLAIQYRPTLALAHLNLAQLLERRGRYEEAISVYRRCSRLNGAGLKDPRTHEATKISALLHLGRLYADQGRLHKAVAMYQEAVDRMPEHYPPQAVYTLLGEAHSRLQQHEEAERWYQAALQAEPGHVPAHLTYGSMLARNKSRTVEAEQWFQRATELAPNDPTVFKHFGQFLTELERHAEAAAQYVRAVELAPQQYDLVLSAATALRHAGHKQRAEHFYRRAAELKPQEARSHLNLGAMLHLNGKFMEAASCYREALRLQPDDVTTLTNLHKLYNLLGKRGTT